MKLDGILIELSCGNNWLKCDVFKPTVNLLGLMFIKHNRKLISSLYGAVNKIPLQ